MISRGGQGETGFCIGVAGYSWTTIGPIAVGVALLVAASTPRSNLTSEPEPLPELEYDFEEIGEYFAQRPVAVAVRSTVVAFEALRWSAGVCAKSATALV